MKKFDPTTLAVLRDAFVSIAHDMSQLLIRTCGNYITSQLRDHHTGVYDPAGRVIASALTLPALAGAGRFQAQLVAKKFQGNIHPGDEFIMNCPYTAYGTHIPDWTFIRPIFYKGELIFFSFSKAHQLDSSGAYPGGYFPRAYDIHAEGMMIPPIKWSEKGKPISHVQELILNNIRYRDRQKLDIDAMFASLKLCEERCIKLLERYGKDTVRRYVDRMIEVMHRAVKAEIKKMPDGVYSGESAADDDGTHPDRPIWVRCKTSIKGDDLFFDFTGSDPQTDYVSSPWANTHPRVAAAFFTTLDPSLAFYHNEGSYLAFRVFAPEGSVVNSKYPMTVGACPVNVGLQIFESVLKCLGQAVPEQVTSGWARQLAFDEFGVDRAGKRFFTAQFSSHGGSGAVWGHDGWPHLGMFSALGALRKGNVETIESRYPWRILKYDMRRDSAGDGRWRGGLGVHIEWLNDSDKEHAFTTGNADGILTDVYAIQGGRIPERNQQYLLKKKSGERIFLYTKRGPFFMEQADVLVQMSQGGAGVGDPAERDAEKVRWDVMNEYVSIEKARDVYKVVINPETFEIDWQATRELRGEKVVA